MGTVHLRLHEGNALLPARVRAMAQGTVCLPLGRFPHDSEGVVHRDDGPYAYIDGPCELRLPPGPVRVQAARGPHYQPLDSESHLAPGKLALRFELAARDHPRTRGWYAGDVRVHGLSPHGALLQAQGEDLAIVQLLLREGESLVAFSGDQPCLQRGNSTVAVNTLNGDPVGGSVSLLHAHRVIFPLSTREQPWSVADWCDQCHRKRGLVVWPDTPRLCEEAPGGEVLAAAVQGQIDAFEICSYEHIFIYHELLLAGLRLNLVGASGRDNPRHQLGSVRTYAQLAPGETCTLENWIEAVRRGQPLASTGPVIDLRSQGNAWLASAGPVDSLSLFCNGQVLATGRGHVEAEVPQTTTHWVAAACQGPQGWAHTSAVWVEVAGQPWRRRVTGRLLAALDRTAGDASSPGRVEALAAARHRLQET